MKTKSVAAFLRSEQEASMQDWRDQPAKNVRHTPGPWYCYQPNESPRQITDGQMRICTMTNRSEELANARLISSAPDLVQALELLLCGCERAIEQGLNQPQVNGGMVLARAALKKAGAA